MPSNKPCEGFKCNRVSIGTFNIYAPFKHPLSSHKKYYTFIATANYCSSCVVYDLSNGYHVSRTT